MAEESRRQFALEELTFLFAALERLGHPCVLMGGQAACYWAQVLPHMFIATSTRPELVRLREKRIPGWLAHVARYRRAVPASETHRKMLAILARHAEPPCVDSAFRKPRSALP